MAQASPLSSKYWPSSSPQPRASSSTTRVGLNRAAWAISAPFTIPSAWYSTCSSQWKRTSSCSTPAATAYSPMKWLEYLGFSTTTTKRCGRWESSLRASSTISSPSPSWVWLWCCSRTSESSSWTSHSNFWRRLRKTECCFTWSQSSTGEPSSSAPTTWPPCLDSLTRSSSFRMATSSRAEALRRSLETCSTMWKSKLFLMRARRTWVKLRANCSRIKT